MTGLSSKQKEELNSAILEYLRKHNFEQSAEHFAKEANVQKEASENSTSSHLKDLLEKKWTSLVKLKSR